MHLRPPTEREFYALAGNESLRELLLTLAEIPPSPDLLKSPKIEL
jgi:hypothetical protein